MKCENEFFLLFCGIDSFHRLQPYGIKVQLSKGPIVLRCSSLGDQNTGLNYGPRKLSWKDPHPLPPLPTSAKMPLGGTP